MDEPYDSFLDYLLLDTTGIMFVGGITMIVVIGIGYFITALFLPRKGFRFILFFSIYIVVMSQLGILIQGYWGNRGFILYLIAIAAVGGTIRIIQKRRAQS